MAGPAVLQIDLAPPLDSDQSLADSGDPFSADPIYCLQHRTLSGRGLRVTVKTAGISASAGWPSEAGDDSDLAAAFSVPFGAPKGQTLILDRDGATSGSDHAYFEPGDLTAAAVPYIAPIVLGIDLSGCRIGWRVVHSYYQRIEYLDGSYDERRRDAPSRDWVCDPNAHTPHCIRWPEIPDGLAADDLVEIGYTVGQRHRFTFQAALACGEHAQGAITWCTPCVIEMQMPL